ncbi:MAG TPA: hypothetical protein VIJ00_01485, partial [Nakamurella sp.]
PTRRLGLPFLQLMAHAGVEQRTQFTHRSHQARLRHGEPAGRALARDRRRPAPPAVLPPTTGGPDRKPPQRQPWSGRPQPARILIQLVIAR